MPKESSTKLDLPQTTSVQGAPIFSVPLTKTNLNNRPLKWVILFLMTQPMKLLNPSVQESAPNPRLFSPIAKKVANPLIKYAFRMRVFNRCLKCTTKRVTVSITIFLTLKQRYKCCHKCKNQLIQYNKNANIFRKSMRTQ